MKTILIIALLIVANNIFSQEVHKGSLWDNTVVKKNGTHGVRVDFKVSRIKQIKHCGQEYKCVNLSFENCIVTYCFDERMGNNEKASSFIQWGNAFYKLDSLNVYDFYQKGFIRNGIAQKLNFGQDNSSGNQAPTLQKFVLTNGSIYILRCAQADCNGSGCWNEYSFILYKKNDKSNLSAIRNYPYQEIEGADGTILIYNKECDCIEGNYFVTSKAWEDLPKDGFLINYSINFNGVTWDNQVLHLRDLTDSIPPFEKAFYYNSLPIDSIGR